MIFFVWIWISPRKVERVFGSDGNAVQDRIKNYKNHKVRIGLTVVAFLFATLAFALHLVDDIQYNKIQAERETLQLEEQAEQEMIESYPEPTLEVLSHQGNQGESLEYELVVEVNESTMVQANTKSMVQDGKDTDLFRLTIPLNSPETPIELVAKNEYKEVTQQLMITRNETEAETEVRIALEAEQEQERLEVERLDAEQKVEQERLAQEAEVERQQVAKQEEAKKAQKDWEREVYKAVNDRMDAIYDDPNRAYLESSALMDEYDNMQIKEVARIYSISAEDVEAIYKGKFVSEYDEPIKTTPPPSSSNTSATSTNTTSTSSTSANTTNSGSSPYYGTCKEYDDGTVVGCDGNDFCKLETEWQQGGVHYFEGQCTKR